MSERVIEFLRKKDLVHVDELGAGACGKTVLLYDPLIEEHFVCKKFAPIREPMRQELYENFVREIKLLHLLHHPNVVRVFNYYLYPDQMAGYILMENIGGTDIEEYLGDNPENVDQIFTQVVDGFAHLEGNEILHRDLRPQNILVSDEGVSKIIDFGFGKRASVGSDFDKSITLNWWCEVPDEFEGERYDYATEVYFVGKLFEKIILESNIDQFSFSPILSDMCKKDPKDRIQSFSAVKQALLSTRMSELPFSDEELDAYRRFADDLSMSVSKIEHSTKYWTDPDDVERKLEDAYRSVMLEQEVPQAPIILNCFLNGAYYFSRKTLISVANVRRFLQLFRSFSHGRKEIVLRNLHTRFDATPRYHEQVDFDDDIPF